MRSKALLLGNGGESEKNISEWLDFLRIDYVRASNGAGVLNDVEAGGKCLVGGSSVFSEHCSHVEAQLFDRLTAILLYESGTIRYAVKSEIKISCKHSDTARELSGLTSKGEGGVVYSWIGDSQDEEGIMDCLVARGIFFQ